MTNPYLGLDATQLIDIAISNFTEYSRDAYGKHANTDITITFSDAHYEATDGEEFYHKKITAQLLTECVINNQNVAQHPTIREEIEAHAKKHERRLIYINQPSIVLTNANPAYLNAIQAYKNHPSPENQRLLEHITLTEVLADHEPSLTLTYDYAYWTYDENYDVEITIQELAEWVLLKRVPKEIQNAYHILGEFYTPETLDEIMEDNGFYERTITQDFYHYLEALKAYDPAYILEYDQADYYLTHPDVAPLFTFNWKPVEEIIKMENKTLD